MNKKQAKALAKLGKPLWQVGAMPYRITGDGQIEVMVVTSRHKQRVIFPKGWKMRGKCKTEAAAQEAREEAGVIGLPNAKSIGSYRYRKRLGSVKALVTVIMFPMRVHHQLTEWREQNERKRLWVKPSEAIRMIENRSLAKLVPDTEEPCVLHGIESVQPDTPGKTKMADKKLDDPFS